VKPVRPGLPVGWILIFLLGMGSGGVLVVALGRRIAREQEIAGRADTGRREAEGRLQERTFELKEERRKTALLENERAARARVVEGELATLRRDLAAAVRDRDALAERYRSAAAERDRTMEQYLAARRTLEETRTDLVKAGRRAAAAEAAAAKASGEASTAAAALAGATERLAALLRPLLQDLRSGDGSLRVRAHEALCSWAGRNLPFRPNGSPADIEADARAIEAQLLR